MKLFNAIAAAALISASLVTSTSAAARPNRIIGWTSNDGTEYYVKPIGSSSVELTVFDQYNDTGFIAVRDCSSGQYRWRANDGYTKNQIAAMTRVACTL